MKKEGFTIWLTGYSGAGKTTISEKLIEELKGRQLPSEMLDGDVVREHLSQGLSFSRKDRDTNVLRIGFVAGLLSRNGVAVVVSAISPYRSTRNMVRERINGFIEVYVKCPIEECERRDVKGLYRKARNGELTAFTGIDDPYEEPLDPEVICYTDIETVNASVEKIIQYLEVAAYIPRLAFDKAYL
ncbi:adenylyl-sulfate kinase [Chitinophaga filiformis]|uniref:Adenylyl-sulfate kinase n=1 Tax=Chitinophaga filiformis TaxID=104663 RepID=A0ABY4HYC6_CHIFI|nr:adenylyl-sulfate kinase [Chitinophaga filiformis]UPK68825.1 adenylyl-sulfate kinase [Chitinophaga filiformis]